MTQHAIQRAKERLGLDVTMADLDAAAALIGTDPRAVFVRRQEDGAESWLLPLKNVTVGAVVKFGPRRVLTIMVARDMVRGGKRGEFFEKAVRAQKRRGTYHERTRRLLTRWRRGVEA